MEQRSTPPTEPTPAAEIDPELADALRRAEKALWAEFTRLAPELLGAILDYVVGGLRELPAVKLPGLPRMADFAVFAVACEVARTGTSDEFLRAYRENQAGADEQVLEDSPVAAAVLRLMAGRQEWRGTPTDLLKELADLVPEADRKEREWPKRANALSNRLKRLAPSLRKVAGIDVQLGERSTDRTRTRQAVLCRLADDSSGSSAAKPLHPRTDDQVADPETPNRPPVVRGPSGPGDPSPVGSPAAGSPDDADDPSGLTTPAAPGTPDTRRGRL